MNTDIHILRELAYAYLEASQDPSNAERRALHIASNDLHPIRPVVLIDELPWNEMNLNEELTLRCQDPAYRGAEWFFRSSLYKYRHFRADMILPPYFPIGKQIHSTGFGIETHERTLATDEANHIVAHEYQDQLETEEDLLKFHLPVISYDQEATMRQYQLFGDCFGDILPVQLKGVEYAANTTWDNIATYRGVTPLLMDLVERPEFSHQIVSRLTDCYLAMYRQYEELDLFDRNPSNLHCTPIATRDLRRREFDGTNMTLRDVWGRGAAQIFASVSKAMHEEFDIEYMKKTVGLCGLVYYGCCEPLDKKIDIVATIPNLRKISITPWADVNVAAEAIGTKYVLSAKPNPAAVAVPRLDADEVRRELTAIFSACRRNGCACDLVLKDISSCGGRPENIFEWERIAMELAQDCAY